MLEFLTATENIPFSVALLVMFGIAVLEGITSLLGFALSNLLDSLLPELDYAVDLETSVDIETPSHFSRLLGWLRIGQVPVLMLFVIFLTSFALIGLALQSFSHSAIGSFLPSLVMSIPAVLLALPVVRFFGGILGKIMPKDETDAVKEESLIGHIATITIGSAKAGSPAEAKVRDHHGTTHYIMVEPDSDTEVLTRQHSLLLVRKSGSIFKAIINTNTALADSAEQN